MNCKPSLKLNDGVVLRIISIASQKGGTGKTTTALNLAVCLTELDQRVLLIDIDPQANLSTGLGLDVFKLEYTIYEVLLNPERGVELALINTLVPNLDLVPSTLNLAGAELELAGKLGREWLLKKAMKNVTEKYNFIIIDTPPSLGLLTQNALIASQEVFVPLQVHIYALRALFQLQSTINLVKEFNQALHISGVICTMYDSRNNLSKIVKETIQHECGDIVLKTVIPMNIALAEAPGSGQPITKYAPGSAGASSYRHLAKEVLDRA